MTSTLRLWALLALLAVAQAAPPPPHANARTFRGHGRRQAIGADLVLTETRVEVFSETQTETFTETFTTTEDASTSTSTSSDSQGQAASTTLAVSASSITSALPLPAVHIVGDIPNPDPNAQTILFLPLESSLLSPDPDSAAPSSTDSPSDSPTASPTSDVPASSVSPGPFSAAQSPTIQGPLLSAYYPDWVASTLAPESIDMSRLDWIDFAFVTPAPDFSLAWDDPAASPALLQRLVAAAHAKNTKVKLSIGGWSGSRYFSPACATPAARTTFVNNVVKLYNAYKLDGIDIDWEYPAQQGEGDNAVNPQDSANFLAMLRLLRTSLPKAARITAAVQDVPFVDAQGNPMTDVSAFAAVLDWVNIMNYDVFGSSDKPGPNAPLANACQDSSQPSANAMAAINAWTAAKFPAGRLMLGVPFYGYLSGSHATQLQHRKRSLASASGYHFGMMRRQSGNGTLDSQDSQADGTLATSTSMAASMSSQSPVGESQTQDSQTDDDLTTSTSMAASMSSQSPNGLSQAGSGSAEPSMSLLGSPSPSQADPAPPSPSPSISTQGTNAEAAQLSSSSSSSFNDTSLASLASTPGTTTLKSPDTGSTTSGQLQFAALLAQNALVPARAGRTGAAVTFFAVGGFTRFWDACSSTPFLSSPYANQVVTYDDPQSLGLKAAYAKKVGILGTAVWDLSGDTAQWDLMNALRTGLGKPV